MMVAVRHGFDEIFFEALGQWGEFLVDALAEGGKSLVMGASLDPLSGWSMTAE